MKKLDNIVDMFDHRFARGAEAVVLMCEDWQTLKAAVLGTTINRSTTPCDNCVFARSRSLRCLECFRNKVDKFITT